MTVLTGCPRQYRLRLDHGYTVDPEQVASFAGQAVHQALLHEQPGWLLERRVAREITVQGTRLAITGQPDAVHLESGLIRDYKLTFSPRTAPRPEHITQVNLYAWLLARGTDLATGDPVRVPVRRGEILYLFKTVTSFPVPIWPPEEQERVLRDLLAPFLDPELPPELPALEQWKCAYCPVQNTCRRYAARPKPAWRGPVFVDDEEEACTSKPYQTS